MFCLVLVLDLVFNGKLCKNSIDSHMIEKEGKQLPIV
jgi:hypothetical protein